MKEGIKSDYDKGYFLHCLTDYEFYFVEFRDEYFTTNPININYHNNFYNDYSKVAQHFISKYEIKKYPESIREYMIGIDGEPEFIKIEKLDSFVDKISNLNLKRKIKELLEDNFKEI